MSSIIESLKKKEWILWGQASGTKKYYPSLNDFFKDMSQTSKQTHIKPLDDWTLLDLMQYYKIPVASSCIGRGKCQKCLIDKTQLSCQILIRDWPQYYLHHTHFFPDNLKNQLTIRIDYL